LVKNDVDDINKTFLNRINKKHSHSYMLIDGWNYVNNSNNIQDQKFDYLEGNKKQIKFLKNFINFFTLFVKTHI